MAKTIRMRSQISGTRDGVNWPAPGGEFTVTDEEAEMLVKNKQAEWLDAPAEEETATAPAAEETATTKPRGRRPVKAEGK